MKASLGAGYGLCLRLMLEVDPRSSRGQSSEFGLMTRSVAEDVGDCAADRAPPLEILRSTKNYFQKLFGGCCCLCGRRGWRRQGSAAGVALRPPLIVFPMSASNAPLSVFCPPKRALHPRQVSRGARFELLVNEADPVAGPRTTKVSETPLKLKNARLLKCCQPACLNHLSALNAQELFSTDLMPPLLKP